MPTQFVRSSQERNVPLPYELNYLPDDLRKRAKSELFEDEETRVHSLRLLKSMLKEEPNLDWQDDDFFLLSFLRARKFDVKRAFNLVKTFYTVIRKRHELYEDFNFDDVKRTLEDNDIGLLPYRDSEGCAILIIRTNRWNPHDHSLGDIMRCLTSALFHANLYAATHIAGFKVIFDFNGFTMKHLPHVSPTYLWLFAEALQNCFPGRFRAVHMINEGHIFSYIWVVLKQFLSQKLKDRFHFHGKNIKKLHKYFSPSILPIEYGGEQPTFDNREFLKKIKEKSDYVSEIFSYGYRSPNSEGKK